MVWLWYWSEHGFLFLYSFLQCKQGVGYYSQCQDPWVFYVTTQTVTTQKCSIMFRTIFSDLVSFHWFRFPSIENLVLDNRIGDVLYTSRQLFCMWCALTFGACHVCRSSVRRSSTTSSTSATARTRDASCSRRNGRSCERCTSTSDCRSPTASWGATLRYDLRFLRRYAKVRTPLPEALR